MYILKDCVKYMCINLNKDKHKIHKGEPDCFVIMAIFEEIVLFFITFPKYYVIF